jgi:hypothetical protein
VRVVVVRGGGLAGRADEVSVDSADLDDDAAGRLRALVAAVGQPLPADRPPAGRPDGRRVELGVEPGDGDEGTAGRVRFDEHDAPDGAADLVRWVLECPHGVRH